MHKRHRALIAAVAIVAVIGGAALAAAVVDQVVIVDSISATVDVRLGSEDQVDVDVSFRASGGTIVNANQSDNAWIELPESYIIDDAGNVIVSVARVREQYPVAPEWPYSLTLTTSIVTAEAPVGTYNLPLRANVTKGPQVHSASADTATFLALVPEYIVVRVAQTFAVTYDGNGATSGTAPVDDSQYETGEVVTVLANTFSKAQHVFVAWNTAADGTGAARQAGDTFAMGDADVTLYAIWAPVYGITYHGNGQDAGLPPVDSNQYLQGAMVTVLGPGTLTKGGHVFVGWSAAAGVADVVYVAGSQFAMGAANVNLYAQWRPAYVVVYWGNGSTAGTAPVDLNLYAAGAEVTVLGPGTLARDGNAFLRWDTAADGSGASRTAGSTFTMGTANVHLYAQWTPVVVDSSQPDDEDDYPAAPAIANALLRQHGISHIYPNGVARGKGQPPVGNYISAVARAMGRGASFPAYDAQGNWDGVTYIQKFDSAAYAAAVRNFLVARGAALP